MSYNLAKKNILNNSNIKIENYKKNNFYGLINSFLLFFLYFFLLFLVFIDINFLTSFLLIFFMSITVYKMGFILHDCAHNSLFESQILNDFFAKFTSTLLMINFLKYKIDHLKHHKFLGDENLDIDFSEYIITNNILFHLVGPFFGSRILSFSKKNGLEKKMIKKNTFNIKSILMIIFFQLIICIFISSFGKNLENIFFYYGFLATVTLGLSRLRAVAEHGQFIYSKDKDTVDHITVTHKKNFLENIFLYSFNFNYHFEHHLFPNIQSRHYPDINKKILNLHTDNTFKKSMFSTLFKLFVKNEVKT